MLFKKEQGKADCCGEKAICVPEIRCVFTWWKELENEVYYCRYNSIINTHAQLSVHCYKLYNTVQCAPTNSQWKYIHAWSVVKTLVKTTPMVSVFPIQWWLMLTWLPSCENIIVLFANLRILLVKWKKCQIFVKQNFT
jgi:hypothetical protein